MHLIQLTPDRASSTWHLHLRIYIYRYIPIYTVWNQPRMILSVKYLRSHVEWVKSRHRSYIYKIQSTMWCNSKLVGNIC